MGNNFIFGYSAAKDNKFVDYTPSCAKTNSSYPLSALKDYFDLLNHWRSNTIAEEVDIVCDFGSQKSIVAVKLDDVNFTNVYVQGNSSDVWTDPPVNQQYTIAKEDAVQRYKNGALLSIPYQYARIKIPAQSTTDGLSAFRIGRLIFIDTKIELIQNPSYPYEYEATKKYNVTEFLSGGFEKVKLGSNKIWSCDFGINIFEKDVLESQLWQLDAIDEDELIVFLENRGNNSKAWVCMRDGSLKVSETHHNIGKSNNYEFVEVI